MDKRIDRKIKEQEDAQLIRQIKVMAGEDRFDEALEAAKQLDASRIKLAPTLCLIGEVYMHAGMYDEAEEFFIKAYNKTPTNRRILSLLTSLYIEKGEYSEAEYYYKEFIGVASRDLHRYILRYRLDKAKGERMAVLIDTLERLKDYEYIEEWAYELASLYHKSGDDKKALRECDEIVLWFGHGKFVNKAIALKCSITGEPVPFENEDDEEVYSKDDDHVTGLTNSSIDVALIEKALQKMDAVKMPQQEEEAQTDEEAQLNIEETSQTDVDASAPKETAGDPQALDFGSEDFETNQNVGDTPVKVTNDTDVVSRAAGATLIDSLTTDSTMDFWGDVRRRRKQKKEAKAAQEAARKAAAGSAALSATNPEVTAQDNRVILPSAADDEDDDFEDVVYEAPKKDDPFDISLLSDENFKKSLIEDDLEDEDLEENLTDKDFENADLTVDDFENVDTDDDFDEESVGDEPDDDFEKSLFDQDFDDGDEDDDSVDDPVLETPDADSEDDLIMETSEDDSDDDLTLETFGDDSDDDDSTGRAWTEEDKTFLDGLFGEKKTQTSGDVFSNVPDIDYVKAQLSKTFTKFEEADLEDFDILADYDINFVVLCNDKSMKAQISLGIAKALNTYGVCDKSKIFRAFAEDLNKRDFSMIFDRLQGGCLIIDEAGALSEKSAEIIENYVNEDNQQTAIILSETQDAIMSFWKKHQALRAKFLNVINVSKYNEMELVTLAKGYIEERKYELDEDAALILRDYFKRELDKGKEINYDDVMEIVDLAVNNLEKRNVRNLYMTVLDNKYEEARMFRLLPEDFKILL